jgi:predicted transposase YdaD
MMKGKGRVQEQAIQEVAALPVAHPQRENVLDLLGNLKVILEARANIEPEEQELIMQLSPLYLAKIQAAELVGEQRGRQAGLIEGEQQGEVKGQQELVLRQLTRRLGNLSVELEIRVKALPLLQLEELGEALLDFSQMGDLVAWLDLVGAASSSED